MRIFGFVSRAVGAGLALGVAASAISAQSLPQPRNQVSLGVFAEREVANDWTTGTIGTTASGSDPAELAARVNEQMAEALAIAKRTKGVKVTTGAYNTYPEYEGNRIVRWQARQDLVLEGKDTGAIAKLLGRLQERGLLLRGVSFSVSHEAQRALEDELTVAAIASFRARAALVAKSFGKVGYGIVSVSVGGTGESPPVPMYRRSERTMTAMAEAAPAPNLEGGTSRLRVDVSGTIELE